MVEKVAPDWRPAENPDLKVGETVFIQDADVLLREGKVKLISDTPSGRRGSTP
jgi:hypothetical protein